MDIVIGMSIILFFAYLIGTIEDAEEKIKKKKLREEVVKYKNR